MNTKSYLDYMPIQNRTSQKLDKMVEEAGKESGMEGVGLKFVKMNL